jgi:hypothetical protein
MPDRPPTCVRCEQEGTCPAHLVSTANFLRRAREAGQRDTRPPDIDGEFVTIDRARQIRIIAEADRARDAIPVPPPPALERELTPEELTWSVRGEPRTRETFSAPHPLDFPGGLPIPPECPTSPAVTGPTSGRLSPRRR